MSRRSSKLRGSYSKEHHLRFTSPSPARPIRIAVIGTINRDTIIRPDRSRLEGYGGILYNLMTLSLLLTDRTTLIPVVKIGKDRSEAITSQLSKLPNISLQATQIVNRANNHCILRYLNNSSKQELLRGWVGSVSQRQLGRILDADLVLVNFISGGDISRSNLQWLRSRINSLIYMDLHSRTLGRSRDGHRFLRVPPHWEEYLAAADFVQMNETEFHLLSGNEPNTHSCRIFLSLSALRRCHCLIVTLGEKGCLLTSRRGKSLATTHIPAPRKRKIVDTTGCGDIFAAAFIYHYLLFGTLPSSARFACRLATARTGCRSIADLDLNSFRLKGRI